jgi:hypothetical protein
LFSEVAEGEFAISTVRDAVKDIYARARKLPLKWIDDDDDREWDGGIKDMADATVIRAGVDEESGDTLRLTYIYEGKEYESDVRPYDAGYEALLDKLVVAVNVPIAEFRAYRGSALLTVRKLHVRGA